MASYDIIQRMTHNMKVAVVAVLIVAGCRYVDVGGVEPFTFTERESVEPAAKHGGGCSLHIYSFEGVGRAYGEHSGSDVSGGWSVEWPEPSMGLGDDMLEVVRRRMIVLAKICTICSASWSTNISCRNYFIILNNDSSIMSSQTGASFRNFLCNIKIIICFVSSCVHFFNPHIILNLFQHLLNLLI